MLDIHVLFNYSHLVGYSHEVGEHTDCHRDEAAAHLAYRDHAPGLLEDFSILILTDSRVCLNTLVVTTLLFNVKDFSKIEMEILSLVGEDAEGKRGQSANEQYERVRHPRELIRVTARAKNLWKELFTNYH